MTAPSSATEQPCAEAQRQRELIDAIFAPQPTEYACAGVNQRGAQWQAGLAAYRGNGSGHARNALRVQFPTVLAMLGDEPFNILCIRYWHACPPQRGDLAWVGEELPDFIETVHSLDDWQWLGDCARLDWAIWQTAGAASAQLNETDLHRLAEGNPQQLYLQLANTARLVPSAWPIVALYRAHHEPNPDWEKANQLLQRQHAQTALIWRPPAHFSEKITIEALDSPTERWFAALNQGMNLDAALDMAGNGFDFTVWLELAVRRGWLDAVLDKQSLDVMPDSVI